jgi:hypothetical protein
MDKISLSDIKSKVEALNANIAKQKQEVFEIAKANFNELAQELFNKHPDLKSFAWKQYTPYFCDGEPCYFGVYGDEPEINKHEPYERDDAQGSEYVNFYLGRNPNLTNYNQNTRQWDTTPNPDYNPYYDTVIREIESFIFSFGQDILEDMFGEGRVIVTPGKTEVEEVDHD